MPQVKIVARNFMDMVASLPVMKLDMLYDNSFICEAILRSLPPLAKKYVLQMLYIDIPITAKSMEEWVLPDGFSKHKVAIDRLIQLRVMTETFDSGILPREPMPSNITVRLPSLEELEAYAVEQWELMDTNAQLWYIIREYITNAEERGVDSADLIAFLLELSFHVTGKAYNTNTITDLQRSIIKDLSDLGLIKLQQGRKESWFIPTKLATNLSISLADTTSRKQIVSFLQQNAHPRVAERIPSVPENVTDQIRLWESDLNRVEMEPAHFYDEFPSKDVFEAACDFAREYGGLLWEDSKRMRLVVKADILTEMKEFLRQIAITADVFLNSDWEKDLPEDPSGRFDDFKDFVDSNSDICQWIALLCVLTQGCCILLATILRTLGQVKENSHEYEGEYAEPSAPLLRPPELPPNPLYPYVIGEPVHIEPHSVYKNV
ncbi:hypothetical protein H5410_007819 [Solanum commersonii]|uniref:RNA polymerase II transcription factor B subunit 2 n=1 Tax=Solanum commersonii TaxID=4109 RepID=A0A9J6ADV2_SOLCO|nr:hypothetical protein H5410_007819 [Solanum commersonii]